jgi:hypothetical protein
LWVFSMLVSVALITGWPIGTNTFSRWFNMFLAVALLFSLPSLREHE